MTDDLYVSDGEFMHHAARDWPRTNLAHKLICPDCGQSGYTTGSWMLRHREHRRCACGKVMTVRGMQVHQISCGQRGTRPYP